MLPQHRIGRTIENWLKKIYEYPENNIGVVDGNQRKYICFILGYYNRKIGEKEFDLAYQVKSYLDNNFCNPDLSVEFVADYFNVTYKTLLNHFKKRHTITVQEYYTSLRMERAIEMMKEHNLKQIDVFDKVGYLDIRSFRAMLNKYLERKRLKI